jgi:2-haloacid dehalogenase
MRRSEADVVVGAGPRTRTGREQAAPTINAVVFDLGGVLMDWDPRHLYRSFFADDEAAMERFLSTVTTPDWNSRQDGGRPWSEAIDELVREHPEHEQLIRAYRDRWRETLRGQFDDSVAILAELRERGVGLYALTNWSSETFALVRDEFEFLAWFDGIVVSGEERVTKPDAAIYRILLERYGLDPSRTVFVDDAVANVERARELGFDAILFRDPDRLRAELTDRGLLG